MPLCAALAAGRPGDLDAVCDIDNQPLSQKPARVRTDLADLLACNGSAHSQDTWSPDMNGPANHIRVSRMKRDELGDLIAFLAVY